MRSVFSGIVLAALMLAANGAIGQKAPFSPAGKTVAKSGERIALENISTAKTVAGALSIGRESTGSWALTLNGRLVAREDLFYVEIIKSFDLTHSTAVLLKISSGGQIDNCSNYVFVTVTSSAEIVTSNEMQCRDDRPTFEMRGNKIVVSFREEEQGKTRMERWAYSNGNVSREEMTKEQPKLAKEQLKRCSGANTATWTNCVGEEKDSNRATYVGEFKNGKQHGQGTYTAANGSKYVGEFSDGYFHGQGTLTRSDGSKYVGGWRYSKFHGQGTFTDKDGGIYVGEFKDDDRHGQGTYTAPNGDKYVGKFWNDMKHGQGTYTYRSGEKYEGEFVWDRPSPRSSASQSAGQSTARSGSSSSDPRCSSLKSVFDSAHDVQRQAIERRMAQFGCSF